VLVEKYFIFPAKKNKNNKSDKNNFKYTSTFRNGVFNFILRKNILITNIFYQNTGV